VRGKKVSWEELGLEMGGGGGTSATYSACWLAAQVLCHGQADTSCECED
jgi:hypothetical protein